MHLLNQAGVFSHSIEYRLLVIEKVVGCGKFPDLPSVQNHHPDSNKQISHRSNDKSVTIL